MPYTNSPRPYKHEYQLQVAKGVDREGKDISHNKPLRNGGTNADGYTLMSPSKNRANNGKKPTKKA